MSLRDLIARHGSAYTYTRASAGTYTAGRYVPATAAAAVAFVGVVQPVTGRMLQALPEGQSASDTRVLYTITALTTRGPSNAPDVVNYKGEAWRVIKVDEHEGLSGSPHYVCLIARQTSSAVPV